MVGYLPVNFDYWDRVDRFNLIQVGWLWCNLEPPPPALIDFDGEMVNGRLRPRPSRHDFPRLPVAGEQIINALQSEFLKEGGIKPLQEPFSGAALWDSVSYHQRYGNPSSELNREATALSRSDLKDWAEKKGYRPRFLFPEVSKAQVTESQLKRTYNNLLLIVAAMALGGYKKDLRKLDKRQLKELAKRIEGDIARLPAQYGSDSIERRLNEAIEQLNLKDENF